MTTANPTKKMPAHTLSPPRNQAASWLHDEIGRRLIERMEPLKMPMHAWLHWQPQKCSVAIHTALVETLSRRSINSLGLGAAQAAQKDVKAYVATSPADWQRRAAGYQGLSKNICKGIFKGIFKGVRKVMPAFFSRKIQQSSLPLQTKIFPAQADAGDLMPESVDVIFAVLPLQTNNNSNPEQMLGNWLRVLRPGGVLFFSNLGPDSLLAQRKIWQERGWGPIAPEFPDMHNLGDFLLQQGFSEAVVDMEKLTLTYPNADAALAELRNMGRNTHPDRSRRTHGKSRLQQICAALQENASNAQDAPNKVLVQLQFELVFCHAIKPLKRLRASGVEGEKQNSVSSLVSIPLKEFKQQLRKHGRTS